MTELQQIQHRNMLMIKLFWFFNIIAIAVNSIVDESTYALSLPLGLLLGVALTFLVTRQIAPYATMLLLVTALYTFLLFLTLKHAFAGNMILLGLIPMFTLLYMNLKATLLSGFLYLVTSSTLFLLKQEDLFPDMEKWMWSFSLHTVYLHLRSLSSLQNYCSPSGQGRSKMPGSWVMCWTVWILLPGRWI